MWFRDLLATFRPGASAKDGPLPPLLLALTLLTGLVDALSYLVLGHVFVANMTGNVVFLGFALPGVGCFWAPASIAAIAAFGVGALAGGHWIAPASVLRAAARWRAGAGSRRPACRGPRPSGARRRARPSWGSSPGPRGP
ncbi:DUF1275 domain-containing protein [Galactobacter valiniphilus]|uniref:DUF1275 domain-containing protein n=2 Tax=Galactobacter valiniphilus TaxID=2676122 RepID=A0A399JMP9_9MICC|nr:DUF1275 domain-containing protein [Galactobacter valiniphilus]